MQIHLQLRDGDVRVVECADCNLNAESLVFIGERRAAIFAKATLIGVGGSEQFAVTACPSYSDAGDQCTKQIAERLLAHAAMAN